MSFKNGSNAKLKKNDTHTLFMKNWHNKCPEHFELFNTIGYQHLIMEMSVR
jgi:hypothetical protein